MSETTEVKYIVRKRFKYGKVHLVPGDVFVPAGGKFDEQILKSSLVALDLSQYRHATRVSLRQKKAPKIGQKAAEQKVLEQEADDVTAEVLAQIAENRHPRRRSGK